MTVSADLFALAVTALTGSTNAGTRVFSPLDWPTWDGTYPCMYIHPPVEDKESLGRAGAAQFTVVATLTVESRFQCPAGSLSSPFDSGAATVENALSVMAGQIERALINSPSLTTLVSQFPFIRTRMNLSAEGEQHLGNLITEIGLEFYQGPEDFYQPITFEIEQITVTTDATNVFDANGTYTNSLFPSAATAAPRSTGPDGRAEGFAEFNFTP